MKKNNNRMIKYTIDFIKENSHLIEIIKFDHIRDDPFFKSKSTHTEILIRIKES